jgi:hypothetical protein
MLRVPPHARRAVVCPGRRFDYVYARLQLGGRQVAGGAQVECQVAGGMRGVGVQGTCF